MDQSGGLLGSASNTKVERRIVEKNRRNQMKFLYSKLYSLLPNHNPNPKETVALPDQIEMAINYIKKLEEKVKKGQEKKDRLLAMGRKRVASCDVEAEMSQIRSPKMEIRETNSSLEILLITGLDNHFIFYELIRILHEHNIDVVAANSSLAGHLMHHLLHAQIEPSSSEFGGRSKVSERLKRFVYGSVSDHVEIMQQQQELWDFDNIGFEPWSFYSN